MSYNMPLKFVVLRKIFNYGHKHSIMYHTHYAHSINIRVTNYLHLDTKRIQNINYDTLYFRQYV